jgi:hypothetical protein
MAITNGLDVLVNIREVGVHGRLSGTKQFGSG